MPRAPLRTDFPQYSQHFSFPATDSALNKACTHWSPFEGWFQFTNSIVNTWTHSSKWMTAAFMSGQSDGLLNVWLGADPQAAADIVGELWGLRRWRKRKLTDQCWRMGVWLIQWELPYWKNRFEVVWRDRMILSHCTCTFPHAFMNYRFFFTEQLSWVPNGYQHTG